MILEKFLVVLNAKGLLAALLALTTTGFVISGEVDGKKVELTLRSAESKGCVLALLARAEAAFEVEELWLDSRETLRRLRGDARDRAEEQNKRIDEIALQREYQAALAKLSAAKDEALLRLLGAANLAPCEDGDPDTGVLIDLARLKQEYAGIVHDARTKMGAALNEAQAAFDRLVAMAKPKVKAPTTHSSDSTKSTSGH